MRDETTAAAYIKNKLRWNLASTDLLSVRLAYEAAVKGDIEACRHLETLLAASRIPMEHREASRKMGNRFAKTIMNLKMNDIAPVFEEYIESRKQKPMTHSVIYGIFAAAAGIELKQALAHYLYAQTSAMVTNCVKAIPLSQSTGQKLLSECYDGLQDILDRVMDWEEEDLCLSAPGFDLRGIQHEKLYSRLYMS